MSLLYSVALSSLLAAPALFKKALTPFGTAFAWLISICVCRFGGLAAFFCLAATFIMVVAADKLAGGRADPQKLRKKSGGRDVVRVSCNIAVAAGMIALYALTKSGEYLLAYAAAMAESAADSLASKIGPLGRGKTIDICTLRETSVGLSGGISLAGSVAALAGAAVIAGLFFAFGAADFKKALLIAIIGLSGCFFDSLLGGLVQVKYRCPACGMITERETHCNAAGKIYKGLRAVNNDAVNLLSNALSALIAIIVF